MEKLKNPENHIHHDMIICRHCRIGPYGFAAYKKTQINDETYHIPVCPRCLTPIHTPKPPK